eukprot:TRINITY_DN9486_c0_g1_i1.p2 TRINITY_DN9486_c0_g1~~TRINITY_DN9486_c0_g1_i1.p2  ORF type:complete len:147 (-),score=0.68 TRINITY_DN9486_c0_g1_i1:1-441(-)
MNVSSLAYDNSNKSIASAGPVQSGWRLVAQLPTIEAARKVIDRLKAAGVETRTVMIDGVSVIARGSTTKATAQSTPLHPLLALFKQVRSQYFKSYLFITKDQKHLTPLIFLLSCCFQRYFTATLFHSLRLSKDARLLLQFVSTPTN